MKVKVNIKFAKMCATCRYWDDPARGAIAPTFSKNIWEVDTDPVKLCMKKKIKVKANSRCLQHSYKIEVE